MKSTGNRDRKTSHQFYMYMMETSNSSQLLRKEVLKLKMCTNVYQLRKADHKIGGKRERMKRRMLHCCRYEMDIAVQF